MAANAANLMRIEFAILRFELVRKNVLTLECIPGFILLMVQSSGSKALRSGALAKATGVSPDTIRHYERIGVLPRASRTQSGYRLIPRTRRREYWLCKERFGSDSRLQS